MMKMAMLVMSFQTGMQGMPGLGEIHLTLRINLMGTRTRIRQNPRVAKANSRREGQGRRTVEMGGMMMMAKIVMRSSDENS